MSTEEIVKVSRNYQITIPARIRQRVEVREGDLVKIVYDEKSNELKLNILKIS
ncbi:AbrB/MazE/SpoVT family DNA-binding domain-containing protein [Sulfuracidifex metallicus]|jgi:AbrB family looped-hinge helix DNA binding protein|uniref:AbrB/MazE/SpoVT family DNA-binding domain-containing protein n=1 Tax=Sulfuracidifex metallicus DSM 6482 = JCM 9184 TaxID=523847 RepID=A0A6A9QHB8_SULME|nr:AbrB/MazE/SpoVT family DNA-binding domain-containing protein [Sulfuracidifex metallicus]MCY0849989.1 AbrB/MazE/SpoVT family DNA-binding domain-containing protein [Sulfuracidifex metallicus]MUN28094.1 AbrB/MazE/SpoVT family DNA-binding domain-containing protein [Sulfuracidifex metallicus DSM 6482 = JCM 9184]WOE51362.1 AbrB/MazE/SpoVT family DNA-binding domain-containing protein [Sulfuracidifex metallicus DSM 6482 = JCM 9184]